MIDARWSNPHRSLRRPGTLDLLLLRSGALPASDVKLTVSFVTDFTVSEASLIVGEPPTTRALPGATGREWTCSLIAGDSWTGVLLRLSAEVPEGRSAGRHKVGNMVADATGRTLLRRPLEIIYVSDQDERLQHPDELVVALATLAFDRDENSREAACQRATTLLWELAGSSPGNAPKPAAINSDEEARAAQQPTSPRPPDPRVEPPPIPPEPRPTAPERGGQAPAMVDTPRPASPSRAERLKGELRELRKEFEVAEAPGHPGLRSYLVNVQGAQLTLSVNPQSWPLEPPSITVDPRWRHRMVGARGQVAMPCLSYWNQTFTLSHIVRSFEREWRKSPGRWQEGESRLRSLWCFILKMLGRQP